MSIGAAIHFLTNGIGKCRHATGEPLALYIIRCLLRLFIVANTITCEALVPIHTAAGYNLWSLFFVIYTFITLFFALIQLITELYDDLSVQVGVFLFQFMDLIVWIIISVNMCKLTRGWVNWKKVNQDAMDGYSDQFSNFGTAEELDKLTKASLFVIIEVVAIAVVWLWMACMIRNSHNRRQGDEKEKEVEKKVKNVDPKV